jgi:hypothetical protein
MNTDFSHSFSTSHGGLKLELIFCGEACGDEATRRYLIGNYADYGLDNPN